MKSSCTQDLTLENDDLGEHVHVRYLVSRLPPMRKGKERDCGCAKTEVTVELRCSLLAAGVFNKLEQSGVRKEQLDPKKNRFVENIFGLQICLLR